MMDNCSFQINISMVESWISQIKGPTHFYIGSFALGIEVPKNFSFWKLCLVLLRYERLSLNCHIELSKHVDYGTYNSVILWA